MAKVLIVDDEPSIRRTLREILEFEKYEVDEASDGLECLVKLKRDQYDVVVMDIKMPKMDGMDALERLQLLVPCLLYTSPSPRDATLSRMPSSA